MYALFRPLLFRLDPERAHHLILRLMRLAGAIYPAGALLRGWFAAQPQPVQAFGLNFINPIGLAAGYDKDGLAWRGLACLGFGHIELGTVTPRPQQGNPPPRLFRLLEDEALINRMGFPGRGAEFLAGNLQGKRPSGLILGVNLGMNRDTPLERAAEDYRFLLGIFAPLADYLAVNVSSPNTAGLRRLQARDALQNLLVLLGEAREIQVARLGKPVPLLVKLSPDLTWEELDDALDVLIQTEMDGVIATNTTLQRDGLSSTRLANESGGLSGLPLRARSTEVIRYIHQKTDGKLPVIGAGGVMGAEDARQKLDAGACLVQVYTGLVYRGPGLVKRILTG